MAHTMPLRIGTDATCADGACGQLSRIIVNPVAREVTHLAVDPKHRDHPGRLVPVDLVDTTTRRIRLRCTLAEFRTLRPAEQTESVPNLDPGGRRRSTRDRFHLPSPPQGRQEVTVDYVPDGEVDIRRELTVRATDGEIGQVQGLVLEPGGHHVTHVLLQKRHLWGRTEVAIPIDAVTKIGTLLVHLSLTKHQVKTLPPVNSDHSAR